MRTRVGDDWNLLQQRMDEIKKDASPEYKQQMTELMESGSLTLKETALMKRARCDWRMWLKLEKEKKEKDH